MTTIPSHPLDDARRHVQDARRKASPFIEKFARFGYAAKGVVYCIVGGLAAMAAFGSGGGGETTGSKGALQTLSDQPFGQILLGLVAVGLAGYAMWQFIRAVEDPEDEGSDGKAIFKRVGFFISGVLHFALVVFALGILTGHATGGGGGSGDEGAQSWSAKAMSYPLGRYAVGATGVGILAHGVWQLVRAFKSKLGDKLHLGRLEPQTRRVVVALSRFGLGARGVVFGIIGVLLALAAYHENPSEARGIGGALELLQQQRYGPWLLGIVAVGLIGYGVYEFAKARYRAIDAD